MNPNVAARKCKGVDCSSVDQDKGESSAVQRSVGGQLLPDAPALLSAPVATPSGRTVPLGALAEIEEHLGPSVIRHLERRRAITLNVSPPEDLALEDAIDTIRNDVIGGLEEEGAVPPGVEFGLSGAAGKLEVAQKQFGNILLLAVIICFLLIAALALSGAEGAWGAWTGWGLYALMLALSAVEFLFRKSWFRYYFRGGPFDRLWSRLFPAERTAQGRRSLEAIRRYREENPSL